MDEDSIDELIPVRNVDFVNLKNINYEITSISTITMELIGSGGFAQVYLNQTTGFVTKVIDREFEHGIRDYYVANVCKHPSIISMFNLRLNDDFCLCYDMPYYQSDLGHYLEQCMNVPTSDLERIKIAKNIVEGVNYLHNCGYTHNDISKGNVLIDRDGHAVITDFGLALINLGDYDSVPHDLQEFDDVQHHVLNLESLGDTAPWNDDFYICVDYDDWQVGLLLYQLTIQSTIDVVDGCFNRYERCIRTITNLIVPKKAHQYCSYLDCCQLCQHMTQCDVIAKLHSLGHFNEELITLTATYMIPKIRKRTPFVLPCLPTDPEIRASVLPKSDYVMYQDLPSTIKTLNDLFKTKC